LSILTPQPSHGKGALCRPLTVPPFQSEAHGDEVIFYADQVRATGRNVLQLQGHAQAEYQNKRISAEKVIYNRIQDSSDASGGIIYQEPALFMSGSQASIKLKSRAGRITSADYVLADKHAHGSARLARLDEQEKFLLRGASYTTCDPDRPYWKLKASRLFIDQRKSEGWANHVTLSLLNVPVFYFPVLSFPVGDKRKSGFLAPKFEDGLAIPYYFNLAPNRDATLTLRYIQNHGMQVQNEWRALFPHWQGELNLDYIHEDEQYNKAAPTTVARTPEKRYFLQNSITTHHGQLQSSLDYKSVSDPNYFSDMGDRPTSFNATHLERKAQMTYLGKRINLAAKVQNFQTLIADGQTRRSLEPYRVLPQLRFNYTQPLPAGLLWSLNSQWDNFDRKDTDGAVEAQRWHSEPRLSARWQKSFGYLAPALTYHYSQYTFTHAVDTYDHTAVRALPSASMDSGLFFERDFTLFHTPLLQTFEPRLFYLYRPLRRQAKFPVFDSAATEFSAVQMFQENRFSSFDRLGDSRHLAIGITNRVISRKDGGEYMRVHIGQIKYFGSRRVNISGDAVDESDTSDLVVDGSAKLGRLNISADVQWDQNHYNTIKSRYRLLYPRGPKQFISLSYLDQQDAEQADAAILWPVHRQWQFAGLYRYSLTDSEPTEWLAGFQFESCCFTIRVAQRRYIKNIEEDVKLSWLLELELKGLVSVGGSIADLLLRDTGGIR